MLRYSIIWLAIFVVLLFPLDSPKNRDRIGRFFAKVTKREYSENTHAADVAAYTVAVLFWPISLAALIGYTVYLTILEFRVDS